HHHSLYLLSLLFNHTTTTQIYTLSLHDALPISCVEGTRATWDQASFDKEVADITKQFTDAEAAVSKTVPARKEFIRNSAKLFQRDRKSTRLNSSHVAISYAVFCLKKKRKRQRRR